MEKKILGISLSVVGIAGLLLCLFFMNAAGSSNNLPILLAGGFLGAVIFFTGIWLVPGGHIPARTARIISEVGAEYSN